MKIWTVLLISLAPTLLFAQNNLGPRLSALGDAVAPVSDTWSSLANPAGITQTKNFGIGISYGKPLFDNEVSSQALASSFSFRNNHIGIGIQRYGIPEYIQLKAAVVYAKSFGKPFSLAIRLNYHQLKISNYGTANGFSVDIGAIFCINNNLNVGAFIENPARQKLNKNEISSHIPSTFNIGATYHFSDKVLLTTTISKVLLQSVDVSTGLEYQVLNILSLRGGLSFNPFKQYVGFGLAYQKFQFDMAAAYDHNLGYLPQTGISYAF